MRAYHFLKDNMCGGYGGEPAWTVGEEREYTGKLKMCHAGYHASPSFYDALSYAKGNMACVVELSDEIIKDTDKYVASKRKLISAVNAEKALRTWGCDCAERALKKAKVKDERSWNAIKVARLYNEGKATKQELAAARDAAWDAARDAAWDAARDAAWDAAWDAARATARGAARGAARAAAWDAAWDAARATARGAAWDAAWDAARGAARATARAAARAAARATAWDAAWDAEIKWQKRCLNKLIRELFNSKIKALKEKHGVKK